MATSPNVLIVLTDEQRFDALGANGNSHIKTPNLDRLAATGVNFQNHTCSNPICTPARASLYTGTYARTHGATIVGTQLDLRTETLATWLSAAGYECGLFGKSHLEGELTNFNLSDCPHTNYYGFHEAMLSEDNIIGPYMHWIRREHPQWEQAAWLQANEELQHPSGYGLDQDGRMRAAREITIPLELTQSAWITRQTQRFIRERVQRQKPFFAVCSFVPPHHPYNPPAQYARMYDPASLPKPQRERPNYHALIESFGHYARMDDISDHELQRLKAHYYALCTMLDDQVASLLHTLKENRCDENTLVIFTSDHGDYLGDHGLVRKGPALFNNVLKVPLIIRMPGGAAGKVANSPTQHEDLAPTILELLGIPVPQHVQGKSLAPLLKGDATSPREFSFFDYHRGPICGVTDGRYKLLRYAKCDSWVLVDTCNDPFELTNLIDRPEHAAVAAKLREALLTWLTDTPMKIPPRAAAW